MAEMQTAFDKMLENRTTHDEKAEQSNDLPWFYPREVFVYLCGESEKRCHPEQANRVVRSSHRSYVGTGRNAKIPRLGIASLGMTACFIVQYGRGGAMPLPYKGAWISTSKTDPEEVLQGLFFIIW